MLIYVASLDMALSIKSVDVGILSQINFAYICYPLGHEIFSSLRPFASFPTIRFFTNPYTDLFPEDNTLQSSSLELSSPNLDVGVSGNPILVAPNMFAPSADSPPLHIPPSPVYHSTCVSQAFVRLCDFHCYSTMVSFHEPRTYREASTNPLW